MSNPSLIHTRFRQASEYDTSAEDLQGDAVAARGHGEAEEAAIGQAGQHDGDGVVDQQQEVAAKLADQEVERRQMRRATGEEAPNCGAVEETTPLPVGLADEE